LRKDCKCNGVGRTRPRYAYQVHTRRRLLECGGQRDWGDHGPTGWIWWTTHMDSLGAETLVFSFVSHPRCCRLYFGQQAGKVQARPALARSCFWNMRIVVIFRPKLGSHTLGSTILTSHCLTPNTTTCSLTHDHHYYGNSSEGNGEMTPGHSLLLESSGWKK
jgi:hypothetical protein